MTDYKIKSHADLRAQMKAVARGEKLAPADAAKVSFESANARVQFMETKKQ